MAIKPEHIINLKGRSYPLWAGILDAATEAGLKNLETKLVQAPTEANGWTAIVEALAVFTDGRTFSDLGDASPKNCSPQIATAAIRMASTRAKGRCLRDALNVGQTMFEELPDDPVSDHLPAPRQTPTIRHEAPATPGPAGSAVEAPAGPHGGAGERMAAARMAGAQKAADEAPATALKCGWRKCGKPVEKSWGEASLAAHGHILCLDHLKEAVVWIEAQKAAPPRASAVTEAEQPTELFLVSPPV